MTGSQRIDPSPFRADASGTLARTVDRTDLHALLAILRRIMEACRNDLHPAADREGLGRWEDDHYVYFGARLSDSGRDVDINVHDGRFMVRLTKLPEDSGLD
jgi:hypothetical protein